MNRRHRTALPAFAVCLVAVAVIGGAISYAEDASQKNRELSVNQVMLSLVAPASDALWGIESPQTDEEWRVLDDAAVTIVAAATLIARGGGGDEDDQWAADDRWQAQTADLMTAAIAARESIARRDVDGVIDLGESLYLPCEGCHLAFHPGVRTD